MSITDFDSEKPLKVTSVTGTPTIAKAQPVYLTGGDPSTTGTGQIVLDWSNISGPSDVALYDQNYNLLNYEIEELDPANETGLIWVYNSWIRDGTVQAIQAYGSGPSDNQNASGTWNNSGQNASMIQHLQDDPLTATDSTPNGNDGTVTGATSTTGEFNGGADFDGADDYINFSTNTSLEPSTVTVVAAVNANNYDNSFPRIVGKFNGSDNTGYQLLIADSNTNLYFRIGNGSSKVGGESNLSINTGENHIVAGKYDQNNVRVFQNGSFENVGSGSNGISHATDNLLIGSTNTGFPGSLWDGMIDEVQIFSEAKSDAWLTSHYDASAKAGQTFFSQEAASGGGGGQSLRSKVDTNRGREDENRSRQDSNRSRQDSDRRRID